MLEIRDRIIFDFYMGLPHICMVRAYSTLFVRDAIFPHVIHIDVERATKLRLKARKKLYV